MATATAERERDGISVQAAGRTRGDTLAKDVMENARVLLRLSDDELVQKAYDLIVSSAHSYKDDDWYNLLGEIFERFAPEAELRNIDWMYRDDPSAEIETASSREGFYQRQAARFAYRAERDQ